MQKPRTFQFTFWQYQIFGWLVVKFVIDFQVVYKILQSSKEIHFSYFAWTFCIDVVAFALTVGMRYLYKYLYKKEYSVFLAILIVAAVSYLASFLTIMSGFFINPLFGYDTPQITVAGMMSNMMWDFPIFFVWSLLYFGIKYWKQSVFERERAEKATMLAQGAQLQMLRYQLNPHFLFNSLNSIWALIDEDKKASKEMVSELAEFLRYSLVSKNYADVPLREEMEAMKHYFSIEKKRFEEKLEVVFEIDPEASDFPVLSFILHPLVENAVKYGMRTSKMPLRILVEARVKLGILTLSVSNSGKWIEPVEKPDDKGTGTGLNNIQLRLENAFPGRTKFHIGQVDDFVKATIVIDKKNPKI